MANLGTKSETIQESSINLRPHIRHGLEGTTYKLVVNSNIYYTKISTLNDFINLYTFLELIKLLNQEENSAKVREIIKFAKEKGYIRNSLFETEIDIKNLSDFINQPNLKRKEFLTKIYNNYFVADLKKKIFEKAKNQFAKKELETAGLKLMNLLGAKTPTEIYNLHTKEKEKETKIVIKSAVANRELNKRVTSNRESTKLEEEDLKLLDVKTLVRLAFISKVLGVSDVYLNNLHNVLLTEKAGEIKKEKKPVIFDPMLSYPNFNKDSSVKYLLYPEFKSLIPGCETLQAQILNKDEAELFEYLKKIEYCLKVNATEINECVKEITKIEPGLGNSLSQNIKDLNTFFKQNNKKYLNINEYNARSNDKNAHKAHQVEPLLDSKTLKIISKQLNYPTAKLQTTFIASEVKSRKNGYILPQISSQKNIETKVELKENSVLPKITSQKNLETGKKLKENPVLPKIPNRKNIETKGELNKNLVLPKITSQQNVKCFKPLEPIRLTKSA